MSGFSGLSYAQIGQISDTLRSKSSNMKDLLGRIEQELRKVGNDDTWSGTAASSAFEEFNKLIQKFPEFEEAVRSCADYLSKVVERYKQVDSAVTGR